MSKFLRDTGVFESQVKKANNKFVVAGIFQKADTKNANGRVYKRKLWESVLSLPEIQQNLKDRTMLGELGHPDIVETTLTNVSHIVTRLELLPTGDVLGEAEILDTPNGQILKTLYDAGVKIGISSRGYIPEGSNLIPEGDALVVPDDFQLIGFDFVLTPSTPGANPSIKESTQRELKKILSESKGKIDPVVCNMIESLGQTIVESTVPKAQPPKITNKLVIGFEGLCSIKMEEMVQELGAKFPELFGEIYSVKDEYNALEIDVNLKESDLNLLSAKINRYLNRVHPGDCKFIKAVVEGKTINLSDSLFKKANAIKSIQKEGENVDKAINTNVVEKYESIIADLRDRYLLAEEVINEMQSQNSTATDVIQDIRNRYLTAESVIKEFVGYVTEMEATMKDVVALYKTAEAVIDDLAQRYTLSEEVITELKNRYLTAEGVTKEATLRYTIAEEVIQDLRERYLMAEGVIDELAKRYTLSESVISELRDLVNSMKPADSPETKVAEAAAEEVTEGYVAEQAEKFGIAFKEAKRLFEGSKGSKEAFEFVLAEKQAALTQRYQEFPFGPAGKQVVVESESAGVPRQEDKLAHIIARQFGG